MQVGKEKLQADILSQRKSSTTLFNKDALKTLEDTIKRTYRANSSLSKDDMAKLKRAMERTIESYDMENIRTDTITEEITDEITEKTRILESTTHVDKSYSKRVSTSTKKVDKKVNLENSDINKESVPNVNTKK
jgi:CxxC motif-containing protein